MALGRNWRAVRLLEAAFPEGPGAREDLLLLFAKAEAGWKHWEGVRALLQGPLGSGALDAPEGWFLLGKALEGEVQVEEAEIAYGRALDAPGADGFPNRIEALVRRARIRGRLGRYQEARADLLAVGQRDSTMAGWVALEMAERAAEDGSREETRLNLSMVASEEVRRLGWYLPPLALLASGDSTGAEAAYWSALPTLASAADRALAWDRVGVLRLARGDSVGARGAFHQVLVSSSAGREALRAAEYLLELGFDSLKVALAGAEVLAGAGRYDEALDAYGAYEALRPDPLPSSILLAEARSLLNLGRVPASLALATRAGESEDPLVAAPAVILQAQALRQLGRGREAREVEDELMARFPERPEAVEIRFSRAETLRAGGDLDAAVLGYRETVEMAPSQNLAGEARMRMGQIFLERGQEAEGLEVYLRYLDDFPGGRRWDEAAFWAGRVLLSSGQVERGQEILLRLRREYPISYYSVRAAELLGEAYDPPIAASADSLPFPGFLKNGLGRFDRLLVAGLDRGAEWEASSLARRVRTEPDPARRQAGLLRLAHELNRRGFTREGINLGWEVRREERPWDRELLAAIYPFPYREVVMAEAGERRVDPYLIAGLIRQESAFWVEARSRADARGLMQVLPVTGRELARASGPRGFSPDDHLYQAEINIHLGVAFFADMRRRFGEDPEIILSAYNAGPSRAQRWRQFPEVTDMPRFVERIPFTETRGYVKNVLANRAIYSWLYAPVPSDSGGPDPTPGSIP
jgi:soluble lytic murein transglycosylase